MAAAALTVRTTELLSTKDLLPYHHPLPRADAELETTLRQICPPTGYGLSLTKLSPPQPSSATLYSPGCYLCFGLIHCRLEALTTPSLGLISLLEQLTELRETFYLVVDLHYNSGIARCKSCAGQGVRKGHGDPMLSPSRPCSQHVPETLQTPSFRVSIEAFIHRHD